MTALLYCLSCILCFALGWHLAAKRYKVDEIPLPSFTTIGYVRLRISEVSDLEPPKKEVRRMATKLPMFLRDQAD